MEPWLKDRRKKEGKNIKGKANSSISFTAVCVVSSALRRARINWKPPAEPLCWERRALTVCCRSSLLVTTELLWGRLVMPGTEAAALPVVALCTIFLHGLQSAANSALWCPSHCAGFFLSHMTIICFLSGVEADLEIIQCKKAHFAEIMWPVHLTLTCWKHTWRLLCFQSLRK